MATEKKDGTKKTTTKKTTTTKETKKVETKAVNKNTTITGMSFKDELVLVYLFPALGLIFSLLKDRKVSDQLKFHYNQSGTSFILMACFGIFTLVPFVGIIGDLAIIVLYVFNVIALVKAYSKDEAYSIPLVCDLSKNIFK